MPESDILTQLGCPLDETNDGSDPCWWRPELDPPFAAFLPVVGLGTYGHCESPSSFALKPEAQAASVDLLQVVLLEGDEALLTIAVVNEELERSQLNLAIPEPATLSLLSLLVLSLPKRGGLALLRRKRR